MSSRIAPPSLPRPIRRRGRAVNPRGTVVPPTAKKPVKPRRKPKVPARVRRPKTPRESPLRRRGQRRQPPPVTFSDLSRHIAVGLRGPGVKPILRPIRRRRIDTGGIEGGGPILERLPSRPRLVKPPPFIRPRTGPSQREERGPPPFVRPPSLRPPPAPADAIPLPPEAPAGLPGLRPVERQISMEMGASLVGSRRGTQISNQITPETQPESQHTSMRQLAGLPPPGLPGLGQAAGLPPAGLPGLGGPAAGAGLLIPTRSGQFSRSLLADIRRGTRLRTPLQQSGFLQQLQGRRGGIDVQDEDDTDEDDDEDFGPETISLPPVRIAPPLILPNGPAPPPIAPPMNALDMFGPDRSLANQLAPPAAHPARTDLLAQIRAGSVLRRAGEERETLPPTDGQSILEQALERVRMSNVIQDEQADDSEGDFD